MSDLLAYAPTEPFRGMTGGSFAAPDGSTIDLKRLLDDTEDGNQDGVIVTDDEFLKSALDHDYRFERVTVPDGYLAAHDDGTPSPTDLRKMRKSELMDEYARRFGQPASDDTTVALLLNALDPENFPLPDEPEGQTPLTEAGAPIVEGDDGEEG